MSRTVSATVRDAMGNPREGLRIDFHADTPGSSTYAVTDAGGVFVANIEPDVPYMVPVMNAVNVEGQSFPAGTIFRVVAPVGEGSVALAEVLIEVIDWSLPAQLARIESLEATIADMQSEIDLLEAPQPPPAPEEVP